MTEAVGAAVQGSPGRGAPSGAGPLFAALDLGTNNCRLLIAAPSPRGFRIVDSFSRIVRLGEGLSHSGSLSDDAMERAIGALGVCADRLARWRVSKVRAVATQACRGAANGEAFIAAAAARTGIRLEVIAPREEASLAVAGCLDLLDRDCEVALVIDIGGGSTELSWIDLASPGLSVAPRRLAHRRLPIRAWLSAPIGVVSLAERFPEAASGGAPHYRAMVDWVKESLGRFEAADELRPAFAAGRAHLVGTSGAITSLAGLHLGLRRYERARVDGLWMTRGDCEGVAARLAGLTVAQRAAEPCIGPDRADLVLAGAAILQAVQELWPCERVRVADRGLREGILLALMAKPRASRGRRRPRHRRTHAS